MGRQAPTLFHGMFSADGGRFAYLYHSVFVYSYERKGGSSVTRGSQTTHLQVINTSDGSQVRTSGLEVKPRDCRHPRLAAVGATHALLACAGERSGAGAPMLVSLETGAITMTGKELVRRNPTVPIDAVGAGDMSVSRIDPTAFVLTAQDGRTYRLDPSSAAVTAASDTDAVTRAPDRGFAWSPSLRGIDKRGSGRVHLERRGGVRSNDDFLAPGFFVTGADGRGDDRDARAQRPAPAATEAPQLFVLARVRKDDARVKLLSAVDPVSLQTRWTVQLPQGHGDWAGDLDVEQAFAHGDDLLVANATQLLRIDTRTGAIIRDTPLLK